MTIALVSGQIAGTTGVGASHTVSASLPGAVTVGNLIVAVVGFSGSGTTQTITDNASGGTNTWTQAGSYAICPFNGERSAIFYAYAKASESLTITATNSGADKFSTIGIAEFSGVDSGVSPLTSTNGSAALTAISSGTVTPSGNGYLFVGGFTFDGGGITITRGSGYSMIYEEPSGSNEPLGAEYQVQSTAAALDANWTISAAREFCAIVAAFAPTAAGGQGRLVGGNLMGGLLIGGVLAG